MSLWCLQISHKNNEIFSRISALAKRSSWKIRALYTANLTLLHYFSDLSSWKNFIGFLGDLKTTKRHLEINWPLAFKTYNPTVQWAAVKTHPSLIKVPPQKLNPDGFIKAAWYLISPGKTSLPWTIRPGLSISSLIGFALIATKSTK